MTLNVSLRVPDGIVLASDSLATLMVQHNAKMNLTAACPKCSSPVELKDIQTPPITVPSSTWPYVQKIYPLKKRFGLATFGSGLVNARSIYNHALGFENLLPDPNTPDAFDKTRDFVVNYFHDQLLKEWAKLNINPVLQPEDFRPFGFQLVGFRNDASGDPIPVTAAIHIGRVPKVVMEQNLGIYWTGDGSVVGLLWANQQAMPNIGAFSLQDAIDYAKFLIRTTSDHQRFSGKLPTVGGDIDVALVTHRQGFRWIAQKELYRVLEN